MRGTRLHGVVVAVVALLMLGATACADWNPPPASIDGRAISEDQVLADVDAIGSVPALAAMLGAADQAGSVPSGLYTWALSLEIRHRVLAERYEVSPAKLASQDEEALRSDIVAQLRAELGSDAAYEAVPKSFLDKVIDTNVHLQALLEGVAEDQRQLSAAEFFAGLDIVVDPRIGTWDAANFEVVPNPSPSSVADELTAGR